MTTMAQPTQDMDISSSFISNNLSNNDHLTKSYDKDIQMDKKKDANVTFTHNDCADLLENSANEECLDSRSFNIKSSKDTLPWLIKFNKVMCSSVGNRSYHLLERLLSLYTQNILTSIKIYCIKAFNMVKLKSHLNSTLTFFHFYWHDIKEHIGDSDSYLNGMSVLLEVYIDMELKAFRHSKDSTKIVAKLLSALWIYLNKSEKHIFRVLLKMKLITKKYVKLCEPIFINIFITLRRSMKSLTDIDYVRCLLVLKMWKRIKENLEERKEVNKIALMTLGPSIPKMRDELLKIIPQPPIGYENETLWLLQPNVFDLKTACNNFLAFEDAVTFLNKNSTVAKNTDLSNSDKSPIFSSCGINYNQAFNVDYESNRKEISNSQNNTCFQNTKNSSKPANQIFSIKKKRKFKKCKPMPKLKSGEIIVIDLTKEDDILNVDKGRKRRKKCKRKLEWLKLMKKKYKVQRQNNEVKCSNQVEIVDAHSTECSENSMDKILLEHLPISDNKVSESTESCPSLEQESHQDNTHHHVNSQNMHDYIHKKKNKELKCMFQHKQCEICTSSLKQNDIQHNKVMRLLKLLNSVGQNVREPKAMINLLKENREQGAASSQHTFLCRNVAKESSEINTQGKGEKFSSPKSSTETILLSKECQNSITNTQSIKQELPTSTDYDILEAETYFQNKSVYVQSDCHSYNSKPMNNDNLETIETIKQKGFCDAHECIGCYKQNDVKSFSYHNSNVFSSLKSEDTTSNAIDNNVTDKKSICDKNIMCMLSDLDKCVDVLNRIGEHIMSVHAEKQRLECLDKADICAVSTTVSGDQIKESSFGWTQNINSLSNSEKLNKILELYGKREFLNACNCKDTHKWDNKHNNTELDQLKSESDNGKKKTIPISATKELHSYGKSHPIFPENKLFQNFISNHIKSEFEQSIKEENGDNVKIVTHESQKMSEHKITLVANNKVDTTESLAYDVESTEKPKQDIDYKTTLQNVSQKTVTTKTHVMDDFENIDILDSILNGDITMEDEQEIFEDSQSSLMSPINYDNSNNVLNCITEFFSQSENSYANEMEERYTASDTENSLTPLPEGSLGTTGILNSLLDFDLTNMDSSENDCTYLNLQAVDPRLIKKSFIGDTSSGGKDNSFELNYPKKTFVAEESNEKELYNDRNNSIDSNVDVVGFGLNTNRIETLEFSSLTRKSSLSDELTMLLHAGNISSELKESCSKFSICNSTQKLNTDTAMGKPYSFQKEDNNQTQSLNDAINRVSSEVCTSNNMTLTNRVPSPRDDFSSLHKHAVEVETNSVTMKQSLKSYNLMSSTDFVSCNTVTASQYEVSECDNSINQTSMRENIRHHSSGKQNHIQHRLEVKASPRTPKRRIRQRKKLEIEKKDLCPIIIEPDNDELDLKYPQVNLLNHQNVRSMCTSPMNPSYRQKLLRTKSMYETLKCIDVQQLRNISKQKQQISLNCHGDSMIGATFKEDSTMEDSRYITEDNVLEDSSALNKSAGNAYILQNTTYFKATKKNVTIDKDVSEVNITMNEHMTEMPSSISHSNIKWSVKNVDVHSSKSVKKQMITVLDEEAPMKKKKLTHKFSSTSEENPIVRSTNQRRTQKKQVTSMKRGFMCTNRRRNMVGE